MFVDQVIVRLQVKGHMITSLNQAGKYLIKNKVSI